MEYEDYGIFSVKHGIIYYNCNKPVFGALPEISDNELKENLPLRFAAISSKPMRYVYSKMVLIKEIKECFMNFEGTFTNEIEI
jgi:hypothetical protein